MSDFGFSLNPQIVRIDLFNENYKWYTTLELKWDRYNDKTDSNYEHIIDTFKRCMKEQHPSYKSYYAICLSPYHEFAHPLMVEI